VRISCEVEIRESLVPLESSNSAFRISQHQIGLSNLGFVLDKV